MKEPEQTSIILIRHGIAVEIGEKGVTSDYDRMLSEEGRNRVMEVALGLKAIGCSSAHILSSPLRRAMETAHLIADSMGKNAVVGVSDALLPGAPVKHAVRAIADARHKRVILVGHMPHLSCLAAYLLAGNEDVSIPFKKAGACSLVCEGRIVAGAASLQWMLPPRILRAIGNHAGDDRDDHSE